MTTLISFSGWSFRGGDFGYFSIKHNSGSIKPNPAAKPHRFADPSKQSPEQPWKTPLRFPPVQSGL
jgi:hypothetical protein